MCVCVCSLAVLGGNTSVVQLLAQRGSRRWWMCVWVIVCVIRVCVWYVCVYDTCVCVCACTCIIRMCMIRVCVCACVFAGVVLHLDERSFLRQHTQQHPMVPHYTHLFSGATPLFPALHGRLTSLSSSFSHNNKKKSRKFASQLRVQDKCIRFSFAKAERVYKAIVQTHTLTHTHTQ